MTKMKLLKVISELNFSIGRLEGFHRGLIMTDQKIEGMDLLLKIADSIRENVDTLEDWFQKDYCEEKKEENDI